VAASQRFLRAARLARDRELGHKLDQHGKRGPEVAVAAVVVQAGGLPRWLGWSGAFIAVAFPATLWSPTELGQIPHMLLDVWVLAASVVLIRRREPAYAETAVAAGAEA
jgi:hypothetical protein